MCLITRQICPIKARKDIVCYKYLVEVPTEFSLYSQRTGKRQKYLTPYLRYLIDDIPTKLETRDKTDVRINMHYRVVGEGMFHAFTKPNCRKCGTNIKQVKCIIPKGTLYYKGEDDDICAKTLILQEIV